MSIKDKKILVTGATGYIGEHVVQKLIQEGCTPELLARNQDKLHKNFSHLPFHPIDISDFSKIDQLLSSFQIVIHLAGRTGKGHIEDPINDFNINALGSLNMLKASANNKIEKFIALSSYEVYGKPQQLSVDENQPCVPNTPYASSVLTRETYAKVFKKVYGLPTLIFRLFNAFGWSISEHNTKGVIPFLINQSLSNKPITVTANPENSLDFIHMDCVTDIIFQSLNKQDLNNDCFNLGSGVSISLKNLAEMILELSGSQSSLNFEFDPSQNETFKIQADITQLTKAFSLKSNQNIKERLKKMILDKTKKVAA